LRINAPLTFGVLHLAPLWPMFLEQHPDVALDITLSDRIVDIIDEVTTWPSASRACRLQPGASQAHQHQPACLRLPPT
jgi:hypothetical protein